MNYANIKKGFHTTRESEHGIYFGNHNVAKQDDINSGGKQLLIDTNLYRKKEKLHKSIIFALEQLGENCKIGYPDFKVTVFDQGD